MIKPNARQTRATAIGLASLCLMMLLQGCATAPELQAVYVATPPTQATLSLLCDPKAPLPPEKMDNGQLALYASALQDVITECRNHQQEFKDELERQRKRAQTRRFQ